MPSARANSPTEPRLNPDGDEEVSSVPALDTLPDLSTFFLLKFTDSAINWPNDARFLPDFGFMCFGRTGTVNFLEPLLSLFSLSIWSAIVFLNDG
mmetsp:Transcript_77880/g.223617  ORF Transcript_77880/g.223617 Transcript_77880/m.223617 type:complete len:95 (-) Transcript_77880:3271-3555(-)